MMRLLLTISLLALLGAVVGWLAARARAVASPALAIGGWLAMTLTCGALWFVRARLVQLGLGFAPERAVGLTDFAWMTLVFALAFGLASLGGWRSSATGATGGDRHAASRGAGGALLGAGIAFGAALIFDLAGWR